ncbi:MAG: hypothetical protein EOM70_02740 [Clostridia bacterium]|nr:hypothetical protein [Clostridia bacterium]
MDCKHQAKFSFKTLFARKPTYTCKKCGVDLEMTTMTQSISRALNSILIAALFFKVLAGKPAADVPGMILSFGVLLSYILVYIIAYYFLITFGKFVEKAPAAVDLTTVAEPESVPGSESGTRSTADQAADATTTSPDGNPTSPDAMSDDARAALAKEQQDLIALYNSYLPDDEKNASTVNQSSSTTPGSTQSTTQATPDLHDTCIHIPQKNWKNYIPSQFNFTCEKCGQPITFSQQTKKHVNLIIMAIIFAILMPSFMNTSVGWLKYLGLTTIAVALSSVAQYYFVTKSKYIINPQAPKSGQSRRR